MTDVDLFGGPATQRRASDGFLRTDGGSDEWLTPPAIIRALGDFDLDPCSPGDRRPWDTAQVHYDASHDGLRRPWVGRVWLNPPYSEAGRWLARLAEHGRGTALVFARTETRTWFDLVWDRATAVLFIRGRLTFHYADGRPSRHGHSGAPSALVAYGRADAELLRLAPISGQYVPLHTTEETL